MPEWLKGAVSKTAVCLWWTGGSNPSLSVRVGNGRNRQVAKANILLIDDDKEFAQDMKEILGVQGYRVSTANSPPEATQLLRREKPDLVLLDIGMPMHDGRRFCTYLKRQERYRDMLSSL